MLHNELLSGGWNDGLMKKEKEELAPTGLKNQDPYCTTEILNCSDAVFPCKLFTISNTPLSHLKKLCKV